MNNIRPLTASFTIILLTHTHINDDTLLLLQVRFTLLIVNETTKEMLKTSDGRGPVHFEGLVENPRFYYRKQMNYLKREEREELLKCLLYVGMMQNRF